MAAKKKKAAPKQAEQQEVRIETDDYLKRLQVLSKGVEGVDFVPAGDELAGLRPVDEWFSTGSIELDRQLGGVGQPGGWPVGRICEVASWEGIGKSTLLDQSIAMAQANGDIVALIDSEKARDRNYSMRLGVKLDKLIIAPVDTIEQGFAACDSLLELQQKLALETKGARPPRLLIFWDSLGGTPTAPELAGDAGDRHVGLHALMIKQNFRRMTIRLNDLRGSLVFTNQFYEKIGMGGLTTTGGGGVRYYTSARVWLTKGDYIKVGDKQIGHVVISKMRKTRLTVPPAPVELGLIYGAGFDNSWTLFEWCKRNGPEAKRKWVETKGGWYYFINPETGEVTNFQRGFLGFGEILAADPDIYRMLVTLFHMDGEE